MFEPGDEVVYTPNMDNLPPIHLRPWDIGVCLACDSRYVTVQFPHGYIDRILLMGITHHPLSPKGIRQAMRPALSEIPAAVQARVAALVFSEKTGQTAQRGFGAADVVRSFLDPRVPRKHIPLKNA
jgi:hypothetical protein